MSDQVEIPAATINTEDTTGAFANSAVARCCEAGARAYRTTIAKGPGKYDASKAAHDAYRNALPPLSGVENIRDFIACVAHGILIDSIRDCVAARLLYAAQVASNVSRQTSAKKPSAG